MMRWVTTPPRLPMPADDMVLRVARLAPSDCDRVIGRTQVLVAVAALVGV
jgi:hypothetical protein